jgi:hypothetical protein
VALQWMLLTLSFDSNFPYNSIEASFHIPLMKHFQWDLVVFFEDVETVMVHYVLLLLLFEEK